MKTVSALPVIFVSACARTECTADTITLQRQFLRKTIEIGLQLKRADSVPNYGRAEVLYNVQCAQAIHKWKSWLTKPNISAKIKRNSSI